MKEVSRTEANLLRILHGFLERAPLEQVLPLILQTCPLPRCLSRNAVDLVQDALAKGCPQLLARAGGWRRERHLRGDQAAEGRLWERTSPGDLGLTFSRNTMKFLLWMTVDVPGEKPLPWKPKEEELTVGDRLLFYFAYRTIRETNFAAVLRRLSLFAAHGLCRLAFPEDFAQNEGQAALHLEPWTTGVGACILEALQPLLAERWLQVEYGKGQITAWQRMRALGQAQEVVLDALLERLDAVGRRDLARFLLWVAARLLRDQPAAEAWTGFLDLKDRRLAERVETYRAALVVLRTLERLQQWERQARNVGYFDQGYAAGQLWKSDWERWEGDVLCDRARAVLHEVEPLRT